MDLVLKFKIYRLVNEGGFTPSTRLIPAIEGVSTFDTEDAAQEWIKENNQRYTEFVILPVHYID